nr:sigma-54-dependent Fis family transcriptional regulator [Bacteroidota bacterium]
IMSESDVLEKSDFFFRKHETEGNESASVLFADIEKNAIKNALKNNNGSVYHAAQELGLARQTVYNKMIKYGL